MDDRDIASETTTLYEGGDVEATLMVDAKKIVSQAPKEEIVKVVKEKEKSGVKKEEDLSSPSILNSASPKAQKGLKALSKERTSEMFRRTTRNMNLIGESFEVSSTNKALHNRYHSGTTDNEDISLPLIKPRGGRAEALEESFV